MLAASNLDFIGVAELTKHQRCGTLEVHVFVKPVHDLMTKFQRLQQRARRRGWLEVGDAPVVLQGEKQFPCLRIQWRQGERDHQRPCIRFGRNPNETRLAVSTAYPKVEAARGGLNGPVHRTRMAVGVFQRLPGQHPRHLIGFEQPRRVMCESVRKHIKQVVLLFHEQPSLNIMSPSHHGEVRFWRFTDGSVELKLTGKPNKHARKWPIM